MKCRRSTASPPSPATTTCSSWRSWSVRLKNWACTLCCTRSLSRASTALVSTTIGPWAQTRGSTSSTLARQTPRASSSSLASPASLTAFSSTMRSCVARWRMQATTTAWARRRRRPQSSRCTLGLALRRTWMRSLRGGRSSATEPKSRPRTRRRPRRCPRSAGWRTATARRRSHFAATVSSSGPLVRRRIVPSPSPSATPSWPRAWPPSPRSWREA
mmetsp:Transcript_63624/g.176980  ORF Transcript_63624/g.176980 Transcript_63624/m.176980 type:complete len:216 (+) Transcript_63624:941-1588(+)